MTKFEATLHKVPFKSPELKCPACEESLAVMATVSVEDGGEVRHVGTSGFKNPNYSVSVKTKLLSFEILHKCYPRKQDDD